MDTPKDIIEKALLGRTEDAGEVAKIVINSLARAGYAIVSARRSAIPAIPVPAPKAIPSPNKDLKQRLVEEIEATTAERTRDWIKDMRTARGGLR